MHFLEAILRFQELQNLNTESTLQLDFLPSKKVFFPDRETRRDKLNKANPIEKSVGLWVDVRNCLFHLLPWNSVRDRHSSMDFSEGKASCENAGNFVSYYMQQNFHKTVYNACRWGRKWSYVCRTLCAGSIVIFISRRSLCDSVSSKLFSLSLNTLQGACDPVNPERRIRDVETNKSRRTHVPKWAV